MNYNKSWHTLFIKSFFFYFIIIALIQGQEREYQLKSAFIQRFTWFVEWPKINQEVENDQEFVFCVLDNKEFYDELQSYFKKQPLGKTKIVVRLITNYDSIPPCSMLFISQSMHDKLDVILSQTKYKPILTVSDTKGFVEKGVLINMTIVENRIRFQINKNAVDDSRLKLSHKLYQLADVVTNK
jgi:hypothetical protein